MSGQLSDFLSANSAEIVDRLEGGAADLGLIGARGPRQLLNAILVALTADDLRPLTTFFELDPGKPNDTDRRLATGLRALEAVARATEAVGREVAGSAVAQLDLAVDASTELSSIARRLSVNTAGHLAKQLNLVSSTSSATGTSLSITMHELRRPLTILNSYGQLLSTGMLGDLPESAQVAIDGITSATEMMIQMVGALAELSRLEDPEDRLSLEVMPVSDIVDAAEEQVSPEAKMRNVNVKRDVVKDLRVNGDRRRLTLAVTNILSNAVKHSPDGVPVDLRVFADEGGQVHFVVTDHGPGFPPEDATHLFDKYFRSAAERQRKVPGSGLGLYIVKTVAVRHQGRVEARSDPGHGAEFEIVIPHGLPEAEKGH